MRMQIWQESQTGHKAEVIEQEQSQGEEEIAERRPYVTLNAQRFFREAMAYKTVVLPPCSSPTATPASPLTLECGNEAAKERSPASSTPPSLVTVLSTPDATCPPRRPPRVWGLSTVYGYDGQFWRGYRRVLEKRHILRAHFSCRLTSMWREPGNCQGDCL